MNDGASAVEGSASGSAAKAAAERGWTIQVKVCPECRALDVGPHAVWHDDGCSEPATESIDFVPASERDQWKSNHDGQVATKRRLSAQYSKLHEAARAYAALAQMRYVTMDTEQQAYDALMEALGALAPVQADSESPTATPSGGAGGVASNQEKRHV